MLLLLGIIAVFAGFVELLFLRGVPVGKLANGEILYLVVGKAEVVVGLEEVVLHFLEVGDGLVDGCDGIMEAVVGILDVVVKEVAELVELLLEIGDVDFLALGNGQLALVFETLLRSLYQQGDKSA